jgi:(p)ppGpp synthase/HD superfamily hydrolase
MGRFAVTDCFSFVKTLEETRAYVRRLHAGRIDAIGRPYCTHLDRVLGHLERLFPDAGIEVRHAALLHGCVEEECATLDDLRAEGYPEATIEMVAWNTRPRGAGAPTYLDWIRHLAENAPSGAIMIKIADNADNNDPRRIAQLPEDERSVSAVYERARAILEKALRGRALHPLAKLETP